MWQISTAIIMNEFNSNKEKALLVHYVNKFDEHHILNIIESGVDDIEKLRKIVEHDGVDENDLCEEEEGLMIV